VCPGYRDQLSLFFRDESESVARKSKAGKSTAEHRKSSLSQANSMTNFDCSTSTYPTSVKPPNGISQALVTPTPALCLRSLSPERVDEGIIFFLNHYIISNFSGGWVDLANSPIWPMLFVDKSFNNSVSSIGYAGLSNVTNNPEHMVLARKKYATSLRNITVLLKDTSNADLDAAFISIMLLAAFEVSLPRRSIHLY